MSWQIIKDRFHYHYPKYFAIGLASLGTALLISYYLVCGLLYGWASVFTFTGIWNMVVYFLAYLLILYGNVRSDNIAYQGILFFVCFMVIDAVELLFLDLIGLSSVFASWQPTNLLIVAYLLLVLLEVVGGVMLYIRILGYVRGTYGNFRGVLTWCLIYVAAFFLEMIFAFLSRFYFGTIELTFLDFILSGSELAIAACIVFTVLRLRH